ncbi:MAG: SMI1/KNR4 family protein, partial [Acidobacteriota bacterium]
AGQIFDVGIRWLFWLGSGLALYGVGWISTLEGGLPKLIIFPFLLGVWGCFSLIFGVPGDVWWWVRGRAESQRERQRHEAQLEAPDLEAAAERLGPLPEDLVTLYRSPRRLEGDFVLSVDDGFERDNDPYIAHFVAIDEAWETSYFPELAKRPWVAVATDGFGNVYAARIDQKTPEGHTPVYFLDHTEGRRAHSVRDFSVHDLVTAPIRENL